MQQNSKVFVGLDTSKLKISVAVAEDGRQGEIRFLGDIDNTPEAVRRLVHKLASRHGELLFCYEAGPTGYGLQRQIATLGHDCAVIAPSHPQAPGRTREDQPPRCSDPGPAAPGRRADRHLGAGSRS
jgi:transposase